MGVGPQPLPGNTVTTSFALVHFAHTFQQVSITQNFFQIYIIINYAVTNLTCPSTVKLPLKLLTSGPKRLHQYTGFRAEENEPADDGAPTGDMPALIDRKS